MINYTKCRWCGRQFKFSDGYFLDYCSKKCYEEAQLAEQMRKNHTARSNSSSSDGCVIGLLRLVWKLKWVILIGFIIYVLIGWGVIG